MKRLSARRRALVLASGLGLGLHMPSLRAQTEPRPRRVGVLAPSTAEREAVTLAPFFDEMRQLGWCWHCAISGSRDTRARSAGR